MKNLNPFFNKRKKVYLNDILRLLNIKHKNIYKDILINDIKDLDQSTNMI